MLNQSFSQVNRSHSKQEYSFPKAPRLPRASQAYIYELPSTLDKRSTSMGIGNRNSRSLSTVPPPGTYEQINDTLNYDINHGRGFYMGIGRDKTGSQGISASLKTIAPGPGRFLPKSTLSHISYSIRLKPKKGGILGIILINYLFQYKQKDLSNSSIVPGPGSYVNFPSISDGRYFQSQIKNQKIVKFGKSSEQRFVINNKEIPGPGKYEQQIRTNQGKYLLSNQKNPRSIIIPKLNKNKQIYNIINKSLLGPGSYNIPSEFNQSIQI